jgi:hypothetical protein
MKAISWKCTVVGLALAVTPIVAMTAPPVTASQRVKEPPCTVRSGSKGLSVNCPDTTVAKLLEVFRRTTGLRAEYPDQLASARISVTLRSVQLHDALRSAFAAFNIAIWEDQSSPSVTWLKLVGVRSGVNGVQEVRTYDKLPTGDPRAVVAEGELNRQDRTHPKPETTEAETAVAVVMANGQSRNSQKQPITNSEGVPRAVEVNTSAASLFPPENKAEMELARESFAKSVGQGTPLAPPPVNRTSAH